MEWNSDSLDLKLNSEYKFLFDISSIPLNPRTHPTNEVSVFEVYVIISLSIFSNPYLVGNPIVWFTFNVVLNIWKSYVNIQGFNWV